MKTLAAACLLLTAPLASAQTFEILLEVGDFVPGAGTAHDILGLAIDDQGDYLIQINADTSWATMAIVTAKGTHMKMGDVLFDPPPGVVLDFPKQFGLTSAGAPFVLTTVDPIGGPYTTDAIYLDKTLQAFQYEPAQVRGLGPGMVWNDFNSFSIGRNDHVLVHAEYSDDPLFSNGDHALIAWEIENGALVNGRALVKAGDVPQGAVGGFHFFGSGEDPGHMARSGTGKTIFTGVLAPPQPDHSDQVVCLNQTIIAQQGDLTPDWQGTWKGFSRVDINPKGDWAYIGYGQPDAWTIEWVLVRNDRTLIRTGQSLPAFAPYQMKSFQTGSGGLALQVTNGGAVFFGCEWSDPDLTSNAGLFLEDALIVQKGVTTIGPYTITGIIAATYRISHNGRYVIFDCVLDDGSGWKRGVVRADLQG